MRYSLKKLTSLYISEIVRLHGVPSSIVLHQALETKFSLSSAYHLQIDGQTNLPITIVTIPISGCHLMKPFTIEGIGLHCNGLSQAKA
ncbi:hypothetical protein CR513_48795, partial [Mucuna pruriens]